MERTIHKQQLRMADRQVVSMPSEAEILACQMQHGVPCIWYRRPIEAADSPGREIFIHGTGHAVNARAGRHIGTFQMEGGALVFHVFEEKRG